MVKATFSFGGKLVLVLVTVLVYTFILVAGIIGGALYAYNNVKVGDLLNLIQQSQWVSEEYAQKTIQQFVSDLQKELSNEGLTLQTIIDISPQAGEMLDGILDNVDQNGIVTIDRETLYNTRVDQLTASLMDVVVVTATLGSIQETMGVSLPDMPVIAGGAEGSEVWLYAAANDNEEKTLDKAFEYGTYTYYTRTQQLTEQPVTEETTVTLYSLEGATADEDGWLRTADGRNIYRQIPTYDEAGNVTDTPRYDRLNTESSCVRQTEEGGFLFTTDALYRKSGLGETSDDYVPLQAEEAGSETEITVPTKYSYQPLYLQDGTAATQSERNAETGRYDVLPEHQGKPLYAMEDVYTQVAEENLDNGVPKDEFLQQNTVYVKTNGLTGLPLLNGINALSAVFDMDTLTLRLAGEYFGVDLTVEMLDDILDVPLAFIGSSVDESVQNIELGAVLDIDGSSDPLLRYLAYGEEGINYRIENGEIVMLGNSKPKTIANVTGSIDTIAIGNIIKIDDSSAKIMQAIQDWTLGDFSDADKVNGLTIGEIMDLGDNPSPIMKALENISIGEVPTAINQLTLEQMLGDIDESDNILYALKDCTLDNMPTVVQSLSMQDLFADDIYGENYVLANPGGTLSEIYNNVHLYVKSDGAYQLATEVVGWVLPDNAPENTTFYKLVDSKYVEAAPVNGEYDVSVLYYLDGDDETAEIELLPSRIDFIGGYDETAEYYSKYIGAEAAGGIYTDASLYYFNVATESFVRITELDEVTRGDGDDTIIGYKLNANSLPEGMDPAETVIYTRGEVQGIWKYMLTNEAGVEEIAALSDIGTLMSNITYNINNKSLRDMRDDGVLDVSSAGGSDPLEADVPPYLVNGQAGVKLGDLSINNLLNLTAQALNYLNNPELIPTGGNA